MSCGEPVPILGSSPDGLSPENAPRRVPHVKVAVASLIVGTVLSHFGITTEQMIREFGLSQQQIVDLAERCAAWALPNLLLGSLVIVPVWFLIYLFRPPGPSSSE
jgi:hypothetical protein